MSEPTSTTSNDSQPSILERNAATITFLMGSGRGLSAIGIALLLFIIPDKSVSMLGNKMGFFWLFSGIALLRLNRDDPTLKAVGKKTSMLIAVAGIFAGLLMVTRRLTVQFAPEGSIVILLGVVMMLTGLIHLWSEWRVGGAASQSHRVLHALLGVFELILGLTLVISPLDRSRFTYMVVTIWALLFGILAIIEAIAQWAEDRRTSKAAKQNTTDSEQKPDPA